MYQCIEYVFKHYQASEKTSKCGATNCGQTSPNLPMVIPAFSKSVRGVVSLVKSWIKRSNKGGIQGCMSAPDNYLIVH